MDQTSITKIVKNSNFTKIHNSIKSGKSIPDVAQFHGLDIPVTWAYATGVASINDPDNEYTVPQIKKMWSDILAND